MKKTFIFSIMTLAIVCACQKSEPLATEAAEGVEITVGAVIDGTKTAYVPEGRKVFWVNSDALGLKYTKTEATASKNDNIKLSCVSGAGTNSAKFKGKLGTTNAEPDGKVMVFYYPQISTVTKSGSVTDENDFILGGNFPKIQNTSDVNFEPNLMYGVATNVTGWPTTAEATCTLDVNMKNVMSVLDFTVKGEGSVKRMYITDLNSSAEGMFGDYTVQITNGEFDSFATLPAASSELDRTITAEFNKPITLSSDGAHAYVVVMPRTYSNGIKVGIELTDGSYMIKKISTSFTTESNKAYTVPALTFVAASAGKGMAENVEYSYKTFTDDRDEQVYRYATLKDGRDWMLDNLRYLPDDLTPGSAATDVNAGVWYPVLMNAEGTDMCFGTAEDVAKYGYVYNVSTAFAQDPDYIYGLQKAVVAGEITSAEATKDLKALDNKGICPTGWHIPTEAEYTALYTTAYKASVSALSADGFSFRDVGYVNVSNYSATSDPTELKFGGYANNRFNSAYIILTSFTNEKQIKAAMFNGTNNTAGVLTMMSRYGSIVRCVKNAE